MADFADDLVSKVVNKLIPEPLLAPFRGPAGLRTTTAQGTDEKPRESESHTPRESELYGPREPELYKPRAIVPSEGKGAALAGKATLRRPETPGDEELKSPRPERADQLARECQEIQRSLQRLKEIEYETNRLVKETEAKRRDSEQLVEKAGHESKEARREVQGLASTVAELRKDIRKLESAQQQLAQAARVEGGPDRKTAAQQESAEGEDLRIRRRLTDTSLPRAPTEGGGRAEDAGAADLRVQPVLAGDIKAPDVRATAPAKPDAGRSGAPAPPETETETERAVRPAVVLTKDVLGPAEVPKVRETDAGAKEGAPLWGKDWATACESAEKAPKREVGWESRATKAQADEEWQQRPSGIDRVKASPTAKLGATGREERFDYERGERHEGLTKAGASVSAEKRERDLSKIQHLVKSIYAECDKYQENVKTGEYLTEAVLDSVVKCVRRLAEFPGRRNEQILKVDGFHHRRRSCRHTESTFPGPVTVLSG